MTDGHVPCDEPSLVFGSPQEPVSSALCVAPLADIVFLLICFFVLATEMVRTYKDPAVQLPVIVSDASMPEAPAEIVINMRLDRSLSIAGRALAIDELSNLLQAELTTARQRVEPLRVVIRADRRQRYEQLDRVLKICGRAGLTQIVLRAMPGGTAGAGVPR